MTKAWLDAAERLMRIDGKSELAIERCIDWATANDFWAANILSMPTLRRQWDKLELQAKRERKGSPMGRQYDAAMESLAEADARLAAMGMPA